MTSMTRPTAAVLIIGDEVLSGKVEEQNIAFFIQRFRMLGVELERVAIVGDTREDIASSVREMSLRYDHVCTTGGIGPTHDDITMDAIAYAFDVELVEDPALLGLVHDVFGESASEAHRRLARVPEGSTFEGINGPPWPTVVFRNITIFPGIPRLLQSKFDVISSRYGGMPSYWGHVDIRAREVDIYDALNVVVAAHPNVEIGSYPRREADGWRTRLTVECLDVDLAKAALEQLERAFSKERIDSARVHASNRDD
jgi:molybdenum cofactor synthesis domain-containing protein